jgi:hypothetical protein
MSDVSKKEAVAISAAIAAHLTRQGAVGSASDYDLQMVLESLVERLSELEKKVDELTATLKEAKRTAEGKKK